MWENLWYQVTPNPFLVGLMEKRTYDKLKKLEAEHQRHLQAKKRLKVYYGWSKINKIQKREAIAVAFENEEGAGWENSRSGKSLRKTK